MWKSIIFLLKLWTQPNTHISHGVREKQLSVVRFNLRVLSFQFPDPFLSCVVHGFFCAVLHIPSAWLLFRSSGSHLMPVRNTSPWDRSLYGSPNGLQRALEEFLLLSDTLLLWDTARRPTTREIISIWGLLCSVLGPCKLEDSRKGVKVEGESCKFCRRNIQRLLVSLSFLLTSNTEGRFIPSTKLEKPRWYQYRP